MIPSGMGVVMSDIRELCSTSVWQFFDEILRIYRPSGGEEELLRAVREWADKRRFNWAQDSANIVVTVPATAGMEKAPIVVLQAHADMVYDSAEGFDEKTMPIPTVVDGDWVHTGGKSSLGADNGLGLAMALAVAEEPVHGPLQILITVDEERGLTGAKGLNSDLLQGRLLVNLDSEEGPSDVTIGCAGGGDTTVEFSSEELQYTEETSGATLNVILSGLAGGHSGVEIHKKRTNAIICLAGLLRDMLRECEWPDFGIIALEGGGVRNKIPSSATCKLWFADDRDALVFVAMLSSELTVLHDSMTDDDRRRFSFQFKYEKVAESKSVMGKGPSMGLLAFIQEVPNGVLVMSQDVAGAVETSSNLGTCRMALAEGPVTMGFLTRSAVNADLEKTRQLIGSLAEQVGGVVTFGDPYPGWKPDSKSPFLKLVLDVSRQMTGKECRFGAIHAGLECGIIGDRIPGGVDAISFGPKLENVHTRNERANIPSVAETYRLLCEVLKAVAEGQLQP